MPTYGGYSPQAERYGGGKPNAERIHSALLEVDGKSVGLTTGAGSYAWIEDLALARALAAAWGTNARGANEFDPRRTQSMLPRWEGVFQLAVAPDETPVERRERLVFRWQALGKSPTTQQTADDLFEIAGAVFVAVLHASGPNYYPGSTDPNPYDLSGFTTATTSVNWYSGAMNFAVQTQQPTGMPSSVYKALVGEMATYLDGALSAWATFSIGEFAHAGSSGFWMDEPNFDLEMLDA